MNSFAGVGLGLREEHFEEILTQHQSVPWLELLIDNYLDATPERLLWLESLRQKFPLVFHSVTFNLAGIGDFSYAKKIKDLIDRLQPEGISDHLCWTNVGNAHHHDLLPFPYNKKSLDHVVDRVSRVQDMLDRELWIENQTTYVDLCDSEMDDLDFLLSLSAKTGCRLLVDVNNVYVNCTNRGKDPVKWMDRLPRDLIAQWHIAGFQETDELLVDTHDRPVNDKVWQLLRDTQEIWRDVPGSLERDGNIPPLKELIVEIQRASNLLGVQYA